MKRDSAYRFIKSKIMEGAWDPDTAINVNEIADELGMSRTPIHKALTQLEQEGFLTIIPQVGVFVKLPDREEVLERVNVCANLDALMAEQAAFNLSDEDLDYLESILIKMDDLSLSAEEYSTLNVEFHTTIYKASGYTFTINLARQLWDYLNYVGTPELLFMEDRRKRSQSEHWLIYYALKDQDSRLAKRLVELHMRRVAEVVSVKFNMMNTNHQVLS